jgi:hypothetical protein
LKKVVIWYITFGVCVCVGLIHSTCFPKLVLVAIHLPLSYDDTYYAKKKEAKKPKTKVLIFNFSQD